LLHSTQIFLFRRIPECDMMALRETRSFAHEPPAWYILRHQRSVFLCQAGARLCKENAMGKHYVVQSGDKYGRLTVISEAERYHAPCGQSPRQVVCRCECGQIVTVRTSSVRSGLTVSCGCAQREAAARSGRNSATHGMEGTPTYKAWSAMKERCLNPSHAFYRHYGGRGIAVCDKWLKFENFLEDMGERVDGLTLDRIDNNGDYEPGNVRWATWSDQNCNRRNNVVLSFDGDTLCIAEWARRTGILPGTIGKRLANGYSIKEALTLPLRTRRI
jgi:hypothetical protein